MTLPMRTLLYTLLFAASSAAQESPPFRVPDSVDLLPDLVYARYGARALRLDLYLPKQGKSLPSIVWVHGGGGEHGDKTRLRRQAAELAAHGFAGACIEYRMSAEASFPAQIFDVKAAVRWLRANAAQYRLNPDKIGAAGGSVGGQLVALLALTPNLPEFEGPGGNPGVSSKVQAVVAMFPVTDFVPFGKKDPSAANAVAKFLGVSYAQNPAAWEKASPVTHVTKDAPPFLFLHGDADKNVDYHQSVTMADKLNSAGARAEIFIAKGAAHAFTSDPQWFQPMLDRIRDFFDRTLR